MLIKFKVGLPKAFKCTHSSMSHKSKNPFAVLATDSDSEAETVAAPAAPSVPSSPPFRVWQQPETRFRGDKSTLFSSPFKNKPHHPKKDEGWVSIRDQRWNQPQFEDDVEGLQLNGQEHKEPLTPTGEKEIFPDALGGSNAPSSSDEALGEPREIVLEGTVAPKQESMTAVAWAERIKKSLEKAEAARAEKAKRVDPVEFKEALGRLSFFRRPLAATQ
jgi:hypothetical protein